MRRFILSLTLLAVVGVIAAPAGAARYGEVSAPKNVDIGEKLKIKARECRSGPNWNAVVLVRIEDANGNKIVQKVKDADDDGTTKVKIKIKDSKFDPGMYFVLVMCIHEFEGEDEDGVWYEESFVVTVKP